MSDRKIVSTPNAPAAIGPYSQAVIAGGLVHCSGQIPLDPATGKLIEGDITAQTERVFENLSAVLTAAGSSFSKVLKCNVYMSDMAHYKAINEVYGRYFSGDEPPARAAVAVKTLPMNVDIEIDCIAQV